MLLALCVLFCAALRRVVLSCAKLCCNVFRTCGCWRWRWCWCWQWCWVIVLALCCAVLCVVVCFVVSCIALLRYVACSVVLFAMYFFLLGCLIQEGEIRVSEKFKLYHTFAVSFSPLLKWGDSGIAVGISLSKRSTDNNSFSQIKIDHNLNKTRQNQAKDKTAPRPDHTRSD